MRSINLRFHCVLTLLISLPLHFALGESPNEAPVDFRTLRIPYTLSILESADLLAALQLSDNQKVKLNSVLDKWKSDYLQERQNASSGRSNSRRRRVAPGRRNKTLRKAVIELLDDQQHQKFEQMLQVWSYSPVQSRNVFLYNLELTKRQLIQIHSLETEWTLFALRETEFDYEFPRDPATVDRGTYWSQLRQELRKINRTAWEFRPRRNEALAGILTPEQTRRWKQGELQWHLQVHGFRILLVDFSHCREGTGELRTGSSLDFCVPYYEPPFGMLQWEDEQLKRVRALIKALNDNQVPAPKASRDQPQMARDQWKALHEARTERMIECMRQIETVMTEEQRATWWHLVGEPADNYPVLGKMKENSLFVETTGAAQ